MKDTKTLRILFPTGVGTKGIDYTMVDAAKLLLKEFSDTNAPIIERYSSFRWWQIEDYLSLYHNTYWGLVVETQVRESKYEYAKRIMIDMNFLIASVTPLEEQVE